MTSSLTWLNVSHGIHAIHVDQCEPFLFMPSVTLLRCHVASPKLAMCHSTSHASKNVKSRPPWNPTKFYVVTQFRETISTEKSVSSPLDLKKFRIFTEITIFPLFEKIEFSWDFTKYISYMHILFLMYLNLFWC